MAEVGRLRRARASLVAAGLAALAASGCGLKPEPLTVPERAAQAAADRQAMFARQEPLTRPLTLREAFRRALAYNLDSRVKVMEEALAQNDLDLSRYDLLPKVYIDANYTARNNLAAYSSQSITNGSITVPPSTSSNIDDLAAQLNLSWNILDFGVSYFNARQQANRVLVADEERRKVVANLLQDVRRAFWRAAGAQRLHQQVQQAIREAQNALPAARKVETEGLKSPVDSLRYQKALLDLIGQLEAAGNLLDVSKVELASLINLPPGQPYTLAVPAAQSLRIRSVPMPIRQMEEAALIFNPDVREQSYQTRISADETRKALLRLLPGFTISANPNYDSNTYLVHNEWITGSAHLAGYLSNLILVPANLRRADINVALSDRRREAVGMAVLAKLYIAYQQYVSAASEYRYAVQLSDVDQRLYQQIANRTATDVQGDLERVSAEVSAVFSMLRRYRSYADAQAALGRLYAALGIDPPPSQIEELDIASVDRDMRRALADYKNHPPAAPAPAPGDSSPPGDVAQHQQEPPQPQAALPSDVSRTAVASGRIEDSPAAAQSSAGTNSRGPQSALATSAGPVSIGPN
jgi:outer membrane protein TolC